MTEWLIDLWVREWMDGWMNNSLTHRYFTRWLTDWLANWPTNARNVSCNSLSTAYTQSTSVYKILQNLVTDSLTYWTNEWMNEWMMKWMNEWMNEGVNDWLTYSLSNCFTDFPCPLTYRRTNFVFLFAIGTICWAHTSINYFLIFGKFISHNYQTLQCSLLVFNWYLYTSGWKAAALSTKRSLRV